MGDTVRFNRGVECRHTHHRSIAGGNPLFVFLTQF